MRKKRRHLSAIFAESGVIVCSLKPMEHFPFGPLAAIFTTTAFLPQAVKVIRTRDTRSLSLTMYIFMFTGTTLWTFHGIYLQDKAIIYSNIITSVLNAVILTMKIQDILKERQKRKKAS